MKITRLRAAAAFAVLGILLGAAPLAAQFEYQVDVMSRYIWRGFDLFPNNNPAFQPSITYSFGESGFSLNIWGSFSLGERDIYKYLDEIDLTLDYSFSPSESVDMSVGFINYGYYFIRDFTFKDDTSQEVYVSAGLPNVFFSPTVTAFYDFDFKLGEGLYVLLEGNHTLELSERFGLDFYAGLGYSGKHDIDESGFSDLTLGLSLPIKLGDWRIVPRLNYTFVFLEAVNEENELWFGISIIR